MLGAALDPLAELHIYDLKGGADWLPLAQVAHAFRVGDEPEDITYLLTDLRDLARGHAPQVQDPAVSGPGCVPGGQDHPRPRQA